jgi:hypothetical protein
VANRRSTCRMHLIRPADSGNAPGANEGRSEGRTYELVHLSWNSISSSSPSRSCSTLNSARAGT